MSPTPAHPGLDKPESMASFMEVADSMFPPNVPLTDDQLTDAVIESLMDPLGWTDDTSDIRALRVIRMPRAYTLVEADRVRDVMHAPQWLAGLDGMELARGGTVVTAIEAGEAAVARVAAGAR